MRALVLNLPGFSDPCTPGIDDFRSCPAHPCDSVECVFRLMTPALLGIRQRVPWRLLIKSSGLCQRP